MFMKFEFHPKLWWSRLERVVNVFANLLFKNRSQNQFAMTTTVLHSALALGVLGVGMSYTCLSFDKWQAIIFRLNVQLYHFSSELDKRIVEYRRHR